MLASKDGGHGPLEIPSNSLVKIIYPNRKPLPKEQTALAVCSLSPEMFSDAMQIPCFSQSPTMKGIITARAYGLKKEILYLILIAPQFLQ